MDYGAKGQSYSLNHEYHLSDRLQATGSPMTLTLSTTQRTMVTDVPTLAIHKLLPRPSYTFLLAHMPSASLLSCCTTLSS
jgi:hypothetical protein